MSLFPFHALPAWAMALSLGAHLALGLGLGLFHFRTLLWGTSRFAAGGSTLATVALIIGRFVLLSGVLTLASLEGAAPLLVTALGVLAARRAVMRRVRMAVP